MILLKNNLLFIHRNKAGGSSLRDFFSGSPVFVEDYRTSETINYKGKLKYFENVENISHCIPFEKKHKWITVTREPVSWYQSFFFFHAQKKKQRGQNNLYYNHKDSKLFSAFIDGYNKNIDFDVFIDYFYQKKWPAFSHHYEFFNSKADYVLNLEYLSDELSALLIKEYGDDFNCKEKLKVKNPTLYSKYNLNREISDESIEKIKELESKWYLEGRYINLK